VEPQSGMTRMLLQEVGEKRSGFVVAVSSGVCDAELSGDEKVVGKEFV
jgi:hypothetical protein